VLFEITVGLKPVKLEALVTVPCWREVIWPTALNVYSTVGHVDVTPLA